MWVVLILLIGIFYGFDLFFGKIVGIVGVGVWWIVDWYFVWSFCLVKLVLFVGGSV